MHHWVVALGIMAILAHHLAHVGGGKSLYQVINYPSHARVKIITGNAVEEHTQERVGFGDKLGSLFA